MHDAFYSLYGCFASPRAGSFKKKRDLSCFSPLSACIGMLGSFMMQLSIPSRGWVCSPGAYLLSQCLAEGLVLMLNVLLAELVNANDPKRFFFSS